MKRYAFIDVSNTVGSSRDALGFGIDWAKLFNFLKGEKWQCDDVFYYEGRMDGRKFDKRHKKLEIIGYTIRTKLIFLHKNKERKINFICEKCTTANSFDSLKFQCAKCSEEKSIELNDHGKHPKANFDVELTVDALDYALLNTELLIFTGDGDFRYLAEKLISKGALVTFISTSQPTLKDRTKRFSTRLKDLVTHEEIRARELNEKPRVRFLEMNNFRNLIGKDKKAVVEKENAAKRDVSE